MIDATHIVSLGNRCATSYNLRRYFGFQTAYPFDWWITPYGALLEILVNPSTAFLYDPDLLRLSEDRFEVIHNCGVRFTHEFPRERAGTRPVVENFCDFRDGPAKRTAHLLDRFLGLNVAGNRVAFVREGEVFGDLERALARLFPNADWTVVTMAGPPRDEANRWKGDPVLWDAELSRLDLRLISEIGRLP